MKKITFKTLGLTRTFSGIILVGLILFALLNWLWFVYYQFYNVPMIAIDVLVVVNGLISFMVGRKIPLATELFIGMNILAILLGYVLLQGFLKG